MVSVRKTLVLLFISAASALPAITESYSSNSNGVLSDSMVERDSLNPRVVCKASDPNNQAFQKNKANGSAFCSTYLQSTVTSTVTPVSTKAVIVTNNIRTTTSVVSTVRTTVLVATMSTKIGTVSTVVMRTSTGFITDYQTATSTYISTTTPSFTFTLQRVGTVTQQVTETITKAVAAFVTTAIDIAVTTVIPTSVVYTGGSTTISRTLYSTTTALVPVVIEPEAQVYCGVVGYTLSTPADSTAGSFSVAECKEACDGLRYFGLTSTICSCYLSNMAKSVRVDASSNTTFYDMRCNSANASNTHRKRAVHAVSVPSYLPNKSPSAVSSACSCLVTKPAAAVTAKVTAKTFKTVTTTQTQQAVSTIRNVRTTFITDRKTSTSILSSTTTITSSQIVAQTNHQAATTTKVQTYIITNFDHLVYVYKTQFVTDTNFNTLTITSTRTIPSTRYNTVTVTSTPIVTKDVYTTSQTVLATTTVTIGESTITSGTTTIYGTI